MPIPRRAALSLLALLPATPALAESTPDAWEPVAVRHIELTADRAGQVHEVRISPLFTTTLVFNAPLPRGAVVLEGRESFLAVTVDEAAGLIVLLPSESLSPGKQLSLTVRFADGAVPAGASFRLVVHPTRAEPQVNVYRLPRSAESFQVEARQERERAEQCEAQLAQAQAEQKRPGGLTGLIGSGLVKEGSGVSGRDIFTTARRRPGDALRVEAAHTYAARGQVAVALEVKNTSAQPWSVDSEGAQLVSKEGARLHVLSVWQSEPLAPGQEGRVVVEAVATPEQARGTYVLTLGEGGGARTVTLRGVTFP
ncbi:DUF2381 family protein [Archangium sp.]|uniref:DUF2381 family protein n=1 Tax=Archangium sp. TaxID=1872627 RepID=UPI00286A6BD6|nr:DUF2381 family protein [Archangium sp.]